MVAILGQDRSLVFGPFRFPTLLFWPTLVWTFQAVLIVLTRSVLLHKMTTPIEMQRTDIQEFTDPNPPALLPASKNWTFDAKTALRMRNLCCNLHFFHHFTLEWFECTVQLWHVHMISVLQFFLSFYSRELRERVLLKNSCSIDHQHDKTIADHQPLTTANDKTMRRSAEKICWEDLLRKSAEKICWEDLLRRSAEENLLRRSAEKICW